MLIFFLNFGVRFVVLMHVTTTYLLYVQYGPIHCEWHFNTLYSPMHTKVHIQCAAFLKRGHVHFFIRCGALIVYSK